MSRRLASSRSAAEETWRVFRIMSEFVEGFETMSKVPPAVSVFGSARATPDDPHYGMADELGAELVRRGFAVITGGGPGIMEAANRGAARAGGESIGLNIYLPEEQLMGSVKYINPGSTTQPSSPPPPPASPPPAPPTTPTPTPSHAPTPTPVPSTPIMPFWGELIVLIAIATTIFNIIWFLRHRRR